MPKQTVIAERLYLTSDRARIVRGGDSAAAFLFAIPGQKVDAEKLAALGYDQGGQQEVKEEKPKPETLADRVVPQAPSRRRGRSRRSNAAD